MSQNILTATRTQESGKVNADSSPGPYCVSWKIHSSSQCLMSLIFQWAWRGPARETGQLQSPRPPHHALVGSLRSWRCLLLWPPWVLRTLQNPRVTFLDLARSFHFSISFSLPLAMALDITFLFCIHHPCPYSCLRRPQPSLWGWGWGRVDIVAVISPPAGRPW